MYTITFVVMHIARVCQGCMFDHQVKKPFHIHQYTVENLDFCTFLKIFVCIHDFFKNIAYEENVHFYKYIKLVYVFAKSIC